MSDFAAVPRPGRSCSPGLECGRYRRILAYSSTTAPAGTVYVAPPGAHLMVTPGERLALCGSSAASRYRPAANMLFESVARVFGSRAIGIVLSGMLDDGASGSAVMIAAGGLVMAQSETSAQFFDMPAAAIDFGRADLIASPSRICDYLPMLDGAKMASPPEEVSSVRDRRPSS